MKTLPTFDTSRYSVEGHELYYRKLNDEIKRFVHQLEDMDVDISLTAEDEDISIEGQFEPDQAKEIREDLESGNPFAWFCAKVEVSYKNFKATDYLGGCSYKSLKDFKAGGYYEDMLNTCIDEINRDIESHNQGIKSRYENRMLARN